MTPVTAVTAPSTRAGAEPIVISTRDWQRFFAKVDHHNQDRAVCWEWRAALQPNGYGVFSSHGKTHRPHRWFWQALHGRIPDRLEIDHTCRNHACVNLQHLELVTHQVNMRRYVGLFTRTHCQRGHLLQGEMLLETLRPNGDTRRACRLCRRQYARQYYHRVLKPKGR